MILTIQQKSAVLTFAIQGEFSLGYEVQLPFKATDQATRTHPEIAVWQGSKIDDFNITIEMAVGVLSDVPMRMNSIKTTDDLLNVAASLYDMCLPEQVGGGNIENVMISVGAPEGQAWFKLRGTLIRVKSTFHPPWEVSTGKPMACVIDLTVRPHFGAKSSQSVGEVSRRKMPHKPWKWTTDWS